jgi:hypothetical protein
MKKLSDSLKESRFVDLINKKFTDEIRKEDLIVNLKELKPVDIGTSVLWADVDLRDGDNYLFTFDEVTDMLKDSEWRLPTVSEVSKLKDFEKDFGDGKYIFTNNGTSLTFYGHGEIFVLSSGEDEQDEDNEFFGWTADVSKYDNNYISIYTMDPNVVVTDRDNYRDKKCSLSARLVKDK